MTAPPSFWTDQNIARMKEMLADGATMREIGSELGCSRNAVVGKRLRMGLPFKDGEISRRKAKGARRAIRARRNAGAIMASLQARQIPIVSYPDNAADLQISPEQRKTLFELRNDTCRWPVGDGTTLFFCGGPADNTIAPYCPGHAKRASTGMLRPVSLYRTR